MKLSNGNTANGVAESLTADFLTLHRNGVVRSSPATNVWQSRVRESYNQRPVGWAVTATAGTVMGVVIPAASGASFSEGTVESWLLISAGVTVAAGAIGCRINRVRTLYEAGP